MNIQTLETLQAIDLRLQEMSVERLAHAVETHTIEYPPCIMSYTGDGFAFTYVGDLDVDGSCAREHSFHFSVPYELNNHVIDLSRLETVETLTIDNCSEVWKDNFAPGADYLYHFHMKDGSKFSISF